MCPQYTSWLELFERNAHRPFPARVVAKKDRPLLRRRRAGSASPKFQPIFVKVAGLTGNKDFC